MPNLMETHDSLSVGWAYTANWVTFKVLSGFLILEILCSQVTIMSLAYPKKYTQENFKGALCSGAIVF